MQEVIDAQHSEVYYKALVQTIQTILHTAVKFYNWAGWHWLVIKVGCYCENPPILLIKSQKSGSAQNKSYHVCRCIYTQICYFV